MFIIYLFFKLLFVLLFVMLVLGVSLWVKVRQHLMNPFVQKGSPVPETDDKVIDGEYTVIKETSKDGRI